MDTEEIKIWLSASGRSRDWLADQCGVALSTVNGWLSAGRSIPGPSMRIIERLQRGEVGLNPKLTVAELLSAQQKAKISGKTLDDWIADLIRAEVSAQPPKSESSE